MVVLFLINVSVRHVFIVNGPQINNTLPPHKSLKKYISDLWINLSKLERSDFIKTSSYLFDIPYVYRARLWI